jgi:hypothetical protein
MARRLSPTFVALVYDAALKSYWRRNALSRFLRQAGIAESFLATWAPQESKRTFLDRLFARLPDQNRGQDIILAMARDLAAQETFPDLKGWEDSEQKIRDATSAVRALRRGLSSVDDEVQSETQRRTARERYRQMQQEARQSRETLESLGGRLNDLAKRLGSQEAGYDFQAWFYDFVDFFEIMNRRPYTTGGRQIDGSVTVSGTTYLVELKFTREQAGATDIDSVLKKIGDKADNTMGIMVSVSGYSDVAISEASGRRTPLLLMDHRHLYLALGAAQHSPRSSIVSVDTHPKRARRFLHPNASEGNDETA